ncbi:MAG: tetratricopeptide repeat protein [Acidobacteria bacterium]|nr:MAG: tetratricopeptide repeat protein [Acidobacteriota bacterium]
MAFMIRLGTAILVLGAVVAAFAAVQPLQITIDYPADGSIFPPDITAPTFLWRDPAATAASWRIEITFADGSAPLKVSAPGARLQIGEIDRNAIGITNQLPKLTPQQAAARTWTPDTEAWAAIKKHSVTGPATVTITGFGKTSSNQPISRGQTRIHTSKDPVGAPIFYRDVPLIPSEVEKGIIKPLEPSKLPLIAWRLRNVAEPKSRLLLTGMHTCANCHSFSRDGKTLGMDLDGPANDKGLYAIVPIKPQTSIRNEDVVAWSSFVGKQRDPLRVGFMSQVSPDGKYVVTTVKPPAAATENATAEKVGLQRDVKSQLLFYVANFKAYRFLQVFYPTRGILVWYDRTAKRLQPLPGADDPGFVHANSTWSPDGKYLVFVRARAKDPYPPGSKPALSSNDPNETPIQYDLYRIPFNGGKGGKAEPIRGASQNGKSNSFPKISPDGRWIVFVQASNGLLMRPDSELYIVPAAGGQARRMRCNTSLMNSWHSFSPNGRWMVFSSKSRSPYTQMYLTHIDENGNDSPPILIDNATAANRAVNIPEFVNIPPDGLLKIDTPAADFYKVYDIAAELAAKGRHDAAVVEWRKAVTLNPEDAKARNNLGVSLAKTGKAAEALPHFEKALALDPDAPETHNSLGAALAATGRIDEAIPHYQKALAGSPRNAEALSNLGSALAQKGRIDEAIGYFEKALVVDPEHLGAHVNLAAALGQKGNVREAVPHFRKAVALKPDSAELHNTLGFALLIEQNANEAILHLRKALELAPNMVNAHENLGMALFYTQGKTAEAVGHWRQVLRLEPNHLPVLNQTAWVLATSPDRSVRNGTEAVMLAERAVQLSGGQEPAILDSLAAAYAEVGRFPLAADTARRALALAPQQGNQQLVEGLNARIALYQAKKPFREQPQSVGAGRGR